MQTIQTREREREQPLQLVLSLSHACIHALVTHRPTSIRAHRIWIISRPPVGFVTYPLPIVLASKTLQSLRGLLDGKNHDTPHNSNGDCASPSCFSQYVKQALRYYFWFRPVGLHGNGDLLTILA
ncbi:hypothetical protein KP509_38G022600 [Ceratopteris richardii]|uniref:Uncharacterized protein n=1 Tax=Ceratopteris richardii TaxID=49495 RepID=A0A8T2Q342_CERRI|nr:hypothetical protein KP509_38G022600 [Ceratopteris richardii]